MESKPSEAGLSVELIVLEALEQISIPNNYKRPNMSGWKYTGADNRRYGYPVRSVTMGLVRDWKTGLKTISTFTNYNKELWELLVEYGKSITKLPFQSICINKDTISQPHYDKNNKGTSCIVALGNFTGGELVVEHKVVDIHNKPFHFDGSKHLHWSLPFEGTRYSLIYFV